MNFNIEKSKEKVYDIVDVEDLGEKTNFCRCWRSKKVKSAFPTQQSQDIVSTVKLYQYVLISVQK